MPTNNDHDLTTVRSTSSSPTNPSTHQFTSSPPLGLMITNVNTSQSHSTKHGTSMMSSTYSLCSPSHYIFYDNFSHSHRIFLASISSSHEPISFFIVIQYAHCREARFELAALSQNNTWTLITLPPVKKAIECKWVYKVKHHTNVFVEHYKERLVSKGYNHTKGLITMNLLHQLSSWSVFVVCLL